MASKIMNDLDELGYVLKKRSRKQLIRNANKKIKLVLNAHTNEVNLTSSSEIPTSKLTIKFTENINKATLECEIQNSYNNEADNCTANGDKHISELPKGTDFNDINFLRNWAIRNKLTLNSVTELLSWLKTNPNLSNIPRDARTLLRTPRNTNLETMGNGHFYYFGLQYQINELIHLHEQNAALSENKQICLDFNVDGLPVYHSKNTSFWPILCKCSLDNIKGNPFPVAIYYGPNKPPLEKYLEKFVSELQILLESAIDLNYHIKINSFCCDAPARAFLLNTKSHNSYYPCGKCQIRGKYINKRMIIVYKPSVLRCNESFRQCLYSEFQKGRTPLADLPMDLISAVPFDYMHCVCLGVMRKILYEWKNGSRQSKINKIVYEEKLSILQKYWPSDFNRCPRSIDEVEHWKATELRSFLLYYGPFILENAIPLRQYKHFLMLNFSMRILLSNKLNSEYNDYANELLHCFVKYVPAIYREEFCIYNIHTLTHLASDAKKYGSLSNVNCFAFENYLGYLKTLLNKSNQPLQQIIHRIAEREAADITITRNIKQFGVVGQPLNEKKRKNSLLNFEGNFYEKALLNSFERTTKKKNNCVLLEDGTLFLVQYIVKKENFENVFIFGLKLVLARSFSLYPTDSSFLNMILVSLPENEQLKEYHKAVEKMKILEDLSSVETDSDVTPRRPLKQKKDEEYVYSSSDEMFVPKVFSSKQFSTEKTMNSNLKQPYSPSTDSLLDSDPEQECLAPLPAPKTISQIELLEPIVKQSPRPLTLKPDLHITNSSIISSSEAPILLNEIKKNRGLLEKIIRDQEIQNQEIKIIKIMINSLNLSKISSGKIDVTSCKSFDDLKNLNEELTTPETMDGMIFALSSIGGKDKSDTVKRVLNQLICHELALKLTWFDRKNSTKNCFGSLTNVVTLVLESVRKNVLSSSTTSKDVEIVSRAWFKNAPDRMGGRSERNKNENPRQ